MPSLLKPNRAKQRSRLLGARWLHPPDPSLRPRRIVVRGMNWLGDAAMHLFALRAIKDSLPQTTLAVATLSPLADLYRCCSFVDEVLDIGPRPSLRSAVGLIRAGRFDAGLVLPNSWRAGLELLLAGVPLRAGLAVRGRSPILTHTFAARIRHHGWQHQTGIWRRALQRWGAEPITSLVRLTVPQLTGDLPEGILAPGAAFGPAKKWSVQGFAQAAEALPLTRWTIVGAPGDQADCEALAQALPGATNLCGQTSLQTLAGMLSAARLVLCNDSGIMHLSAVCGTPSVAIFGSTEPRLTGPLGARCEIVRHHLPCSPCFQKVCPLGHTHCMTRVIPEEVASAALRILNDTPQAPLAGLAWYKASARPPADLVKF